MLDDSSMGPEDVGSHEEDMHDYVYLMPDYACIGFDDTVSCSATLSWALRLGSLTKRAYTIMLASFPIIPAWVCDERSGTTAVT